MVRCSPEVVDGAEELRVRRLEGHDDANERRAAIGAAMQQGGGIVLSQGEGARALQRVVFFLCA